MSGRASAETSQYRHARVWAMYQSGANRARIAAALGITEGAVRYYLRKGDPRNYDSPGPGPEPVTSEPVVTALETQRIRSVVTARDPGRWTRRVNAARGLTAEDRSVALALVACGGKPPGENRLAAICGVSRSRLRQALATLTAAGLLQAADPGSYEDARAASWTLTMPASLRRVH